MSPVRKYLTLATVTPLVLVLDQWTKYLAVRHLTSALTRPGSTGFYATDHLLSMRTAPYVLSPTYWDFHYAENTGAAFSFLAGANPAVRAPFFYLVAVVATAFIIYFYVTSKPEMGPRRLALAMVLGGAMGNTLDRFVRGYVIDFIHWHAGRYQWPVFNVADSFVCIGVALILLEGVFTRKSSSRTQQPATP